MKKRLIGAALVATLLAGGIAVAQDGPPPADGKRMERFDPLTRADANKDGVVTRAEVLADVDQRFAKLDVNKDGKVTTAEMAAGRMGRHRGGDGRGGRMLARVDTDKDGAVSMTEQRDAAMHRFTLVDRNSDGKIDQAERDAARELAMMMRSPGGHGGHGRGHHGHHGGPDGPDGPAPEAPKGE